MSLNGISTETGANPRATKLKRRADKLALAKTKRSATGTPGYRVLHNITGSHTAFVGTTTTTVSGPASPAIGRPWNT